MRLRMFDWNTPWFWLTIFYQRAYGKPAFELSIWPPNRWKKWWLNVWQWEKRPSETGAYARTSGDTDGGSGPVTSVDV